MRYRLLHCGDCAVTVEFSKNMDPAAGRMAMATARCLEEAAVEGILEVIPTYRSVTVCFDSLRLPRRQLERAIRNAVRHSRSAGGHSCRLYKIPVCYGGKFGEDLAAVAAETGFSPREVVRRHICRDYLINMIGFLPGFPYLSGMDTAIAAPRLANPRESIPAGSVGIGGVQTGIYPIASPGGWRLIGRTPLKLYDPDRTPAVFYSAGDRLRFIPITEAEYYEIERAVSAGTYTVAWEEIEV